MNGLTGPRHSLAAIMKKPLFITSAELMAESSERNKHSRASAAVPSSQSVSLPYHLPHLYAFEGAVL